MKRHLTRLDVAAIVCVLMSLETLRDHEPMWCLLFVAIGAVALSGTERQR